MRHSMTIRTVRDVAVAFLAGLVAGAAAASFVLTSPSGTFAAAAYLSVTFAAALTFVYALASPP